MKTRGKTLVASLLAAFALTALPALAAARTAKSFSTATLGGACALADLPSGCVASAVVRRPITANVVEYSATLRVGPGPHDVIGIHRVVRERAPFVPAATAKAILLAHGDAWGFDAAFLANLATTGVAADHAVPVFLAQRGIDVWGIDFRWTQVPLATTDFAFMKDWGIGTDARDLGIALAVARAARLLDGDGAGKMFLLGWSRGGQTGYAYLNAETQVPSFLRQVKGFVPVDIYLKTDQADLQAAACTRAAQDHAMIDASTFQQTTGILFSTLGTLAETAPADPSPVLPGLTNRQAALLAGSATYVFFGALAPVPFYHFAGGTFDGAGLPTGLSFTPVQAWLDFERGPAPYEPTRVVADGDDVICSDTAVSFDDHLGEIAVPVLYLGAGGGFGEFGVFTTTLLASTDVTPRVVQLRPADQRAFDIGHADIWNATNAPTLFWKPLADWIAAH